jgi:MFS transporter, DHA1 family, multidrug resistance protein
MKHKTEGKTPKQIIYVTVLGSTMMLTPLAIDLYLPALPTIAVSLHTGIDQLEATVAIFLFAFAVGQLILGPISDTYGRLRVLIPGLVLFIVASALTVTAQSLEQLYLW